MSRRRKNLTADERHQIIVWWWKFNQTRKAIKDAQQELRRQRESLELIGRRKHIAKRLGVCLNTVDGVVHRYRCA